jgi:hypothetical protein
MALWIAGCASSTTSSTSATPQQAPQTYFAPVVTGSDTGVPQTYIFDDTGAAFSQETFYLNLPEQVGPQVLNTGAFTVSPRGLRSLEISTTYIKNTTTNTFAPENHKPPEAGSFAVELAGQDGGLVQMVGYPVQPLVAATQCPNFTSPQTYQFVTIPAPEDQTFLSGPPIQQQSGTWDPTTDTAYGSVDIISSGSTVTFQNINQHTLSSGAPAQPGASQVTGACGSTTLGYVTEIPAQYVVINPGISANGPPQATVGIGASGLLVEDNGSSAGGTMADTSPVISYENVLGAGTGAVGLPLPPSTNPLSPSALAGAQYFGFIYGAGQTNASGSNVVPWSSNLASFGFSNVPSNCPPVGASTSTLCGGDFPVNPLTGLPDPGPNNTNNPNYPYGKYDFAIDLGPASTSSNGGLYTQAIVYVLAGYAGNKTTYSFHAVAIAGRLNGKYAIFLIGMDPTSTQPWAIYLLQSN